MTRLTFSVVSWEQVFVDYSKYLQNYNTREECNSEVEEWVRKNAQGSWIGFNGVFKFQLKSDVNWFQLRWM